MNKGPLNGVTVLELSVMVATPVAGRLLKDLGARVIKIERPEGDGWRQIAVNHYAKYFSMEENPIFDVFNSGKEMISLDLRTEEGKAIFDKLLDKVDVFMTNMKISSLKKLGIHYEQIMPKHPGLIYGLGLGFGEEGPEKDTPAYDTTAFWGRTGFLTDLAVIGMDGSYNPSEAPSSMGDTFTGTTMAMEVCAALYRKKMTGQGDVVKSSLFHNAVFSQQVMMLQCEKPYGFSYPMNRMYHGPNYRAFRCKDGEYIYIARGDARKTFDEELKMFGLYSEERNFDKFSSLDVKNYEWIYKNFSERFLEKTADEWIEAFRGTGVAITKMGHFGNMAEDEQAWANDYLERINYPNGHSDVVATTSIEMDSCEKPAISISHEIGQDTRPMLQELGYTEEEIQKFYENGAVK